MRRCILFALLLAAVPRIALADPVVLSVEDDAHVIVQLGADDGVGAGATLELLHEVVVKDPVTHETLRDTFPLGTMTVLRAGKHVAEAEPEAAIATRVRAGDRVRLLSDEVAYGDPWQDAVEASREAPAVPDEPAPGDGESPTVAVAAPSVDPAERRAAAERAVAAASAVRAIWTRTLGQSIEARIALWEEFLRGEPETPYADSIRDEIASLGEQAEAVDAAVHRPALDRNAALVDELTSLDERTHGAGAVVGAAPARARLGEAIDLAFAVLDDTHAVRATLFARTAGSDGGFQRIELRSDGDGYLRGAIPAALVVPPGVEWFVETGPAQGVMVAAIGRDGAPERIEVDDIREPEAAPRGRSRITTSLDYVDFDGGLAKGYDQYTAAELDFMYRFEKPIYSLRLGFGTLNGTGGPKDIIDDDSSNACRDETGAFHCRHVSYTYVYTEAEFRIRPTVALMVRPQAGRLTRSDETGTADCLDGELDPGCSVGKGFGLRLRLRLGEETETNLALSIGATSNVGTLFEAAYSWRAMPTMPVLLAVQVTDMPVPEDFGVRILADVGYRKLSWVYPSLRVSYQARDVDHAGFSGGLGLNFDW